MNISSNCSKEIIQSAEKYFGQPYVRATFNCAHFVANTYSDVGIIMPKFHARMYPPHEFNLTQEEFERMPVGHSMFMKRKTSVSDRIWTHVAIVYSSNEIIHCSHHFGDKVSITLKSEFIRVYGLVPKSPM